jgi:hypothetical protein
MGSLRTITLSPRLTGTHFPQSFAAEVWSVHDHVVNCRPADEHALVSILDRETDLTARAVLVGTEEFANLCVAVRPGEGIRLAVEGGQAWDGRLPATGSATLQDACGLREKLGTALAQLGARGGLRDAFAIASGSAAPHDNPFAVRAAAVIRSAKARGQPLELAGLVGLGAGFTPSGDDFVTGALCALSLPGAPAGAWPPTGPLVARLGGTTPGGAALLDLAAQRSFPRYLVDFVGALAAARTAGENGVHAAVAAAVAHGETSGTDALAGFLFALTVLCPG